MSSLRPIQNLASAHPSALDLRISLTDNTIPQQQNNDGQSSPDDTSPISPTLSKVATSQRLGPTRLREQLARRKYAKYQEHRYQDSDNEDASASSPASRTTTVTTPGADQAVATNGKADPRMALVARASTFQRGRERVKGLIGRKKGRRRRDGDAEIDILYENQRGTFLFGMPFYSSNSLLNFDPPAWTTSEGKPSPVDITNAQVPDPNWEWAWRTWYVDMFNDVDEEGWQYSFMFQANFAWHGTHPWFHSFVRRRRWIRQRVRKHRHLPDGRVEGGQTMHDAHKLNADYFTIHPTRGRSPDSSYPPSSTAPASVRQSDNLDDAEEQKDDDIEDIKALLTRVRSVNVDREKIKAVLNFMDNGGQDTYYLADEMAHIMSLLLFEHSRRQLATAMLRKVDPVASDEEMYDSAREDNVSTGEADKAIAERSGDDETKRQYLVRAVKAADEEIKKLEFWSDIRGMVEQGDSLTGAGVAEGWDDSWKGLGAGGPAGSIAAQDPAPSAKKVDKGKGKA